MKYLIVSVFFIFVFACAKDDNRSDKISSTISSEAHSKIRSEDELLANYSEALLCLTFSQTPEQSEVFRKKSIETGAKIGKSIVEINNDEKELIDQNFILGRNKDKIKSGSEAGCWERGDVRVEKTAEQINQEIRRKGLGKPFTVSIPTTHTTLFKAQRVIHDFETLLGTTRPSSETLSELESAWYEAGGPDGINSQSEQEKFREIINTIDLGENSRSKRIVLGAYALEFKHRAR